MHVCRVWGGRILPMRMLVRNRGSAMFALLILLSGWPRSIRAQEAKPSAPNADLTQVSIENLMEVEVTSVSKRDQKLSRTAAAIFVITQENIVRSGARNIPDLLRMAPGVDVAQINRNTW